MSPRGEQHSITAQIVFAQGGATAGFDARDGDADQQQQRCYLTAAVKTSSIAGTAHPATGSWFTRESVQSGCATPPYDATPE